LFLGKYNIIYNTKKDDDLKEKVNNVNISENFKEKIAKILFVFYIQNNFVTRDQFIVISSKSEADQLSQLCSP